MEGKETSKTKFRILTCFITIILLGITLFGVCHYYENYQNKLHRFDKIQISYDYGRLMVFSGNSKDEEYNAVEIDVQGEQLAELQNILNNYNLESEKYKIEQTGHYHGFTFIGGITIISADYKVKFNDGTEMIINGRNYQIQYKNGDNYYVINDGKTIVQNIIKIVNEYIQQKTIKITTDMISITGLTSDNTLNINNPQTILKILNKFNYVKHPIISEDLYNKLIEYDKDDYDKGRSIPRELEYKIDFNNGTIIKISLRNGYIGCISDKNNTFIEGIKINSEFVYMIHNIFTDYYREKDKLFEADEIYIQYDNIDRKLLDNEKTEFLNMLLMINVDGFKIKNYIPLSTKDYILKINNNKIILNQNNLYIVYANGNSSYIYSLELSDYIKNLIK